MVQHSINSLIDDHCTSWICSSLLDTTVDGRQWVTISTNRTPKLYSSILGEWRFGDQVSGAAYAGVPGATVWIWWRMFADL